MKLCDYGCGQEAKYYFPTVNKWCCSKTYQLCPVKRKESSIRTEKEWEDPNSMFNSISYREKRSNIMKGKWEDPNSGLNSISRGKKISNKMKEVHKDPYSAYNSILYRKNLSEVNKRKRRLTIRQINKKYPFFSQIEEMRYNPDKPGEKEIQVHCKNHNCLNSKEKGGWFTPTPKQITDRKDQLERKDGNGGSYFYCSQKCKDQCPLYNLKSDPFKNTKLPYTYQEKQDFINEVLRRQEGEYNYNFCEKCYSTKNLYIHHEKPVKTHPLLTLDPDNGIVLCEECHYKIGHKTGTECSTGNLAKIFQQGCALGGQI